ncbi:MAG: hypothetical protein KDE31_29415, partial [Caldilineaceae bacterium]|nr:hypothetical protein [Caldilineaceae bacterium]
MRRTAATDDSLESGRTYAHILRVNLFNFFNLTLFAVGAILVIFGRYNDALITVSAGGVGTIINTWQEIRAKRQLEQITLLVRPTAQVVRDGREQTVDAAHLVEGDLIHLHAGDQALVDGVVTGNGVAEMDEALLTGESELVRKGEGDRLFSGSFCVSGDLHYRADAVGAESYAGQLTAAARTFTPTSTPLQQQVAFIIRLLMILTAFMALIFYIGGFIRDLNFLQNVEASAVLIGLIPYGLFLTINLA